MHAPAIDSLRHERVGISNVDDTSMVLKTYVKTEETEQRGAYDPIEGLARPFPLLAKATTPTVLENDVEKAEISQFSDTLLTYIKLLAESMEEGCWVDEFSEFDSDSFDSEQEREIGQTLLQFAGRDQPRQLFRTVYQNAKSYERDREVESILAQNSLLDITGREQYDFSYIPCVEDVDDWTLKFSHTDTETEEGRKIYSEIVWLRYTKGDKQEERPILMYTREETSYVVLSNSPEFGSTEMDDVPPSIIEAILSEQQDDGEYELNAICETELKGSRTYNYLREFLEE